MLVIKYTFLPHLILEEKEKAISFFVNNRGFKLANPSIKIRNLIKILSEKSCSIESLENNFLQQHGASSLPILYATLQKLYKNGVLEKSLFLDSDIFVCIEPVYIGNNIDTKKIDTKTLFVLSRFAHSRKEKERFILESALSTLQIALHHFKASALISILVKPANALQIAQTLDLPIELVCLFLSHLIESNMISQVDDKGKIQEEQNESLKQWNFHDLLFHHNSRIGTHNKTIGATYRFENDIDPSPAHKKISYLKTFDLYKPDIQQLKDNDLSLTKVMENRASLREYDNNPIDLTQLGELLYRTCRIQYFSPKDDSKGWKYEVAKKPYPCGGATYEQEIYLCVHECKGLESGLYHYDSLNHQLGFLCVENNFTESLLLDVSNAGVGRKPQILMTITARFPRVMWKYESIPYSLILKNVGFLMQNISLVCEAIDLASCVIGTGNSHTFAQMTNIPIFEESPVGEVVLGRKKQISKRE